MASPIITAIRKRTDLKESVLHTAIELAQRASIYGVVRGSNRYMGEKCHCHQRTFQRHAVRLEESAILKKKIIKRIVKVKIGEREETRLRNEVNVYVFTIPWKQSARSHLPMDTMSTNLPPQGERRKNQPNREEIRHPEDLSPQRVQEKYGTLRDEIAQLQKGLRF